MKTRLHAEKPAWAGLHDVLTAQAMRTPEAAALFHQGESTDYKTLEASSNRLAAHLIASGVQRNTFVGICLERTPKLIVSILAVLKAGAAYVPLDRRYPVERLNHILADSGAPFLIGQSGLRDALDYGGAVIDIDQAMWRSNRLSSERPDIAFDPLQLACVLYTSGSTGCPKGVMLRHTALNMIRWAAELFDDGQLNRVAATTSVCFDPSIFEIFAPLNIGGTIVLKNDLLDPMTAEDRPTLLNGVPSAFADLARRRKIPDSVRVINVGGERLRAALAKEIYAASSVEQIWNHYGPTETTICASVSLVARDATIDPPIGQAMAGAVLHVLDEAGQPVAEGVTGELYIGGPGVADGYLNRPDLTEQAFLPDPFAGGAARFYRTGDLVRRDSNGDLFFLGRKGRQVKFRGFRIELDEIEAALLPLSGVRNAAIVALEQDGAVVGLLAALETDAPWTLAALRRTLRDTLPAFMLPTKLVVLPALPLNPSGKVDRQAMAAMAVEEKRAAGTVDAIPMITEVVLNVFRDVLQQPGFGLTDDFFDEGGDSLAAMSAVERLEEFLGQTVPVTLLYQAHTPETLAACLTEQSGQGGHLVTLQKSGDREPIFCLPDIYGRPTSAISLARYFTGLRPVYGLAPGPLEAETIARPSIGRLTEAYIREIRRIQPRGPYTILGYSAGSIPAIDLARSLEVKDESVTLILIDPRAQRFVADARDITVQMRQALRTAWRRGARQAMRDLIVHKLPNWVPPNYAALTKALLAAEAQWKPRVFKGRTIFAYCRRPDGWRAASVAAWARLLAKAPLGWFTYLGGVCTKKRFDVDHYQIMREPQVAALAAWLQQVTAD